MQILIICTGNTCRSPMAAALLKKELAAAGRTDVSVTSAGVGAAPGAPATPQAVAAVQKLGADLSGHRATPLTAQAVAQADKIVAMTKAHAALCTALFPDAAGKIELPDGGDVPDPFGGDQEVYDACAQRLLAAMRALVAQLP